MARLYPPITEETLPAFCLRYDSDGKKGSATLKIDFNLNKAVASKEISGMALRLRTVSTNKYVIDENIKYNDDLNQCEGYALSYDLKEGYCLFSLTQKYNPEKMEYVKVGQYYKAQIAFISQDGTIGYWSTVATIKCIAKPSIEIANFQTDDINVFMNEFIGVYKQDTTTGDSSEKAYSYRFQLFDIDKETVLEDTGIRLHNSENDTQSNQSQDKYYCFRELVQDQIYYLQYTVITINGYEITTPLYQIMNIGSINPVEDIGLIASLGTEDYYFTNLDWLPQEEGLVSLQIIFNNQLERNRGKKLLGNFVITRSSSRDNYTSWQEITRIRFNEDIPHQKIIYDYTVEQGVKYKYAVQQYNRHGFYSNKVYCFERDSNLNIKISNNLPIVREVFVDFEDMFLYDGTKQLKIRFNPKVNSFKNDLQEQKIDTIGSKYPFIFRNGNVCYKEFPISGLISFQQDNAMFFMDNNDYNQMDLERFDIPEDQLQIRYGETSYYEEINTVYLEDSMLPLYYKEIIQEPISKNDSHENIHGIGVNEFIEREEYILITDLVEAYNKKNNGYTLYKKKYKALPPNKTSGYIKPDIYRKQTYSKFNLTGDNMVTERYFKLLVLDWLTNGKPKLFRSSAEGNYVVRLMNVSLTPKNELGRMLHEFSCTAYEIADTDFFTLQELGFININSDFIEDYQWNSINITDIFTTSNYDESIKGYNIDLGSKKVYGFSCTGFEPGDVISFITNKNANPVDIVVGQTGTYIYDGPDIIISLKVTPFSNKGPFSRDIQLKTRGFNYQKFDLITSIGIYTQINQQLIGKHDNFFKKVIVGDTGYETANNVYLSEEFKQIPISQATLDNFQQNIGFWYIQENNKYRPVTSGDIWTTEKLYYTRVPAGEKIITYDLIRLHAKRREIIPIFMNQSTGLSGYRLDDIDESASIFSLTPYGQGYVHSKSISQENPFGSMYEILSPEERNQLFTIHDLLDFVISACNKDIFCLFEVYIPILDKTTGQVEWEPYKNGSHGVTSFSGIFDPYRTSLGESGWWHVDEYYDPSFTFVYSTLKNNQTKEFNRTVSLQDIQEITIENTMNPINLSIGTGVIAELTYRLKFIDYSLEKEDGSLDVFNAKQNYLTLKAQGLENVARYRSANYYQIAYDILVQKYGGEVKRLEQAEKYSGIIKELIQRAYSDQVDQIPTQYLNNEQNIIKALAIDLKNIDNELSLRLANEYNSQQSEIDKYIKNYNSFIAEYINAQDLWDDHNLEYYLANNYLIEEALEDINAVIDPILYHIEKQPNQNLFIILSQMLSECIAKEEKKQREYDSLPIGVSYVSEYIDYLQHASQLNFFEKKVEAFNEEHAVGYWLHKGAFSESEFQNLINTPSYELERYFHMEIEELESLPLLEKIGLQYAENSEGEQIPIGYEIKGLEKYTNEDSLIKQSLFYTIKPENDNRTIINILIDGLETLNQDMQGVFDKENYAHIYGIEYADTISPSLEALINEAKEEKMSLGLFSFNDVNKTKLEEMIDLANLLGFNYETDELEKYFTQNCVYFNELPTSLRKMFLTIVKNYTDSIDNKKSFRQHYSEVITYASYLKDHRDSFTTEEINYIETKINDYINRRNSSEWINTKIDNDIQLFSQGLIKWDNIRRNLNDEPNSELANSINEYVEILNKIISAKREVLSFYKDAQDQIQNFKTNKNLNISSNIRETLQQQINIYQVCRKNLQNLVDTYSTSLQGIRDQGKILGYQDFLKDYFLLIQSNNYSNQDKGYQNEINKVINYYKDMPSPDPDDSQKIQEQRVKEAWKAFLDILAEKYKIKR